MKRIFIALVASLMIFSLSSCETYTYATTQDDIYTETDNDIIRSTVDFNIVINHGTPYYYNRSLLYYFYNGLYYYPFYYDNCWYVRVYRRPFNHLHYRPYFRPHMYDYRFHRGYRPRPNWHRPPINHNRPDGNRPGTRPDGNRPGTKPPAHRPDTRPDGNRPGTRPGAHRPNIKFGGSTQSRTNSHVGSFRGSHGRR